MFLASPLMCTNGALRSAFKQIILKALSLRFLGLLCFAGMCHDGQSRDHNQHKWAAHAVHAYQEVSILWHRGTYLQGSTHGLAGTLSTEAGPYAWVWLLLLHALGMPWGCCPCNDCFTIIPVWLENLHSPYVAPSLRLEEQFALLVQFPQERKRRRQEQPRENATHREQNVGAVSAEQSTDGLRLRGRVTQSPSVSWLVTCHFKSIKLGVQVTLMLSQGSRGNC